VATLVVPPLDLSYPTLGPQVCAWIEANCVFGPGSLKGQPAKLDREKRAFIYRAYELHPRGTELAGTRHFQRCGLEWRKGLAKTELGAWITYAELHDEAPVRFDGWDARGNPVGRPVASPYIPMLAVTAEQVEELMYAVLKEVVENGPDSDRFLVTNERITRLDRFGRPDGDAVPVANAPGSRDGARTTFSPVDEPHRLYLPRQREAHETMVQNLHKRQIEDPWMLYVSTAGRAGQGSVQEDLRGEAEEIQKGTRDDPTLFFVSRWAGQEHKDLSTVELRKAAVADATGPVGEWGLGQFERIARDYDRKGIDKSYWERVWLNRWRAGDSQAFDMIRARELKTTDTIPAGAFVALGFDGARVRDATALTAVDIGTGVAELLALWERPVDAEEWSVPESEVTEAVADAMKKYSVWRCYADPPYWIETVAGWARRWDSQIIEWHTNRHKMMAYQTRAFVEALDSGAIRFGANPNRPDLLRHMGNTAKHELKMRDDQGQPLWVPSKADGRLEDKIDASVSLILAWSAVLDARRSGARPHAAVYVPFKIR